MTATRVFVTLAVVFVLVVALVSLYGWTVVNDLSPDTAEPERTIVEITPTEVIAEGLSIPWDLAFLPDGSMLVTERAGDVIHIESGQTFPIEGVEHVGEGGLLGIALHPDFADNGFVYLYQTTRTDSGLKNRIVRYVYAEYELTFDRVIFDQIPGAQYHDGGRIAFGPDGMLYATVGDAQNEDAAQDPQRLHGSILRITPDGEVPEDNPFGNAVYSYGHRNPQGLTWDGAGNLWSTEHGRSGLRSGYDEINLIQPGGNYGWPESEGDTVAAGTIAPLWHSTADTTWAPASALFYEGRIFFGGLRGEALYEAVLANGEVNEVRTHLEGEYGRIRSVVLGPDGFFYLTTSNRDGRGSPVRADDRIIRIDPQQF
ncbi:MAG: PQQ-dependent sugar dehydrogenase [Candidatus Paceibacterota bacterium]